MPILHPRLQDMGHLFVELRRIDDLLRSRIEVLRQRTSAEAGDLPGLFVSDQEFEELLTRPLGHSPLSNGDPRHKATPVLASDSRWRHLVRAFRLSPFEGDVVLLCLLPEVDSRYERIYAYLQNDMTRKSPSVDLALNLFCLDLGSRVLARQAFLPGAPLMGYHVLCHDEDEDNNGSLLMKELRIEPRVVAFLLGNGDQHDHISPYLRLEKPSAWPDEFVLETNTIAEVKRLVAGPRPTELWLHQHGPDEWGALHCAKRLCAAWGQVLLRMEMPASPSGPQEMRHAAEIACRESLLTGAALFVRLAEVASPGVDRGPGSWIEVFARHPHPVFWYTRDNNTLPGAILDHAQVVRLSFPQPGYGQRLALWRRATDTMPTAEGVDLAALAGRYRLDGWQILEAANAARHAAWQRDHAKPTVDSHDLSAAARAVSSSQLGQLAHRIEPRRLWDDLILPDDRMAQIREMCNQFRYRHVVYDEWGFGSNISLGRGLSALFAGPSGTGKTMAAEIIAKDLELDLYKIDLSGVVSKYIGETEKNLELIFGLARGSNAILLFDEADALFGKRSETKDAHDRYANIEISYLLQKIEEYDGVSILTSNLRQNLDEAFLRRLHFTIEFPLPDEDARLRIWRRIQSKQAPVGDDVDLVDLASRFKLSGGSIRNVWVNAAFLAARDGNVIGMCHMLWAVRREFQKLGKLVDESQFTTSSGV